MTTDPEFDRIAQGFMVDGPTELADRVLDAVIDEVHLTRQRRAIRPPWRLPSMNPFVRLAVVAAIGALFIGGAFTILSRPGQPAIVGTGPSPAPSPTPVASASGSAAPSPTVAASQPAAPTLPPLTARFTSPTYGYSIGTAAGWTATPATKRWVGDNNSGPAVDVISVTGTDTSLLGASQALPKGTTFAQWLVPFHQFALESNGGNPACAGGDPSSWPPIQIGNQVGRLEMDCNAAEAVVAVGGRVYVFDWGNDTLNGNAHLDFSAWTELLKSVTFNPTSAKP